MSVAGDRVLARLDEANAPLVEQLHAVGEHFAAGFLELRGASPLRRMARAVRRRLERADLPRWQGEPLYPAGQFSWCYATSGERPPVVNFSFSHALMVHQEQLAARVAEGPDAAKATYTALRDLLGDYPVAGEPIDMDLAVGGRNYTHSILHFGRIAREGLSKYEERIETGLAQARQTGSAEREDFFLAMEDTLQGVRAAIGRSLHALRRAGPPAEDEQGQRVWARLVAALEQVPWNPARSFYEALVATNFMYYIDGTDNLGRFDQDLGAWYEADVHSGALTHDEGVALVGRMWDNIDANSAWNVAIGGTSAEGKSAANQLTLACLQAARGRRRPNLAMRLSTQTPEPYLDAALDAIASGGGIPALYNEELYLRALREAHLNLPPQDIVHFAFGGCTEVMVHGRSNVGSLDAGLNLPLILSAALRKHLLAATDFEALWQGWADEVRANVDRLVRQVSQAQEEHARYQPQPIRSLFVDDCLEAGVEYNAGGARYNWSVVNVGGLGNVADSLAALRELVFDGHEVTAPDYWAALEANYHGHEALRQRAMRCPRYGNDDPRADELAQRVARLVFDELRRYAPWRGGRFLPSCLMFTTYAVAGKPVMATPDGRLASEPIADSIGSVAGRDRVGPTALVRSVAGIPQHLAPGTLVTNFRFTPALFTPQNRPHLKDLIRTYFQLGGLQMQITVVDQATLHKAVANPEAYGDLIVRVGGFSEYWRNLPDELRRTVLERTEHAI